MAEPCPTTHARGENTGLGLSAVYGIVRMLGGAVAVKSAQGEGSQIDMNLPKTESAAVRESESGPNSRRVLVVDDGAGLTEVMVEVLRTAGHRAEGFTDPRRALEAFQAAPAALDLIVTDLTMPEMSGLELSREVRLLRADVPILLMTGYDHRLTEEDAARLNIADVIAKPFTMAEFMAAVDAVWSRMSEQEGHSQRD